MDFIEAHYHREGLVEIILELVRNKGSATVKPSDLSPVDAFHVRGAEVTAELAQRSGFTADAQVLDVGCGIGGAARHIAEVYDCLVMGVDIVPEYIRTAKILSEATGQQERTRFICGNALTLPFEDHVFDAVWTQHVQMNIEDKQKFYSEISRVLKPAGVFSCYEILSKSKKGLSYPLPWASDDSASFLFSYEEMHAILLSMEFTEEFKRDETEEGVAFLEKLNKRISSGKLPSLSLKLLMGDTFSEKINNLLEAFKQNRLELKSMIYRKKR